MATGNSFLEGKSAVEDNGTLNMEISAANAQWKMTADSSATTLDAKNGGIIDMTFNPDSTSPYQTLTVDNLKGSGASFLMNTDLVSETDGDKIVIKASADGGVQYISVYDKSLINNTEVKADKKLLLVTDASGNSKWEGQALDTGGLWEITPTIKQDNKNWYLVMEKGSVPLIKPNHTAETLIGFTDSAYSMWRTNLTDDTLRKRLGDLRYGAEDGGVWARVKSGKLDAGSYDGSYQMYQVGLDKQSGNTAYGFAVDHAAGKNNYAEGTGEKSLTDLSLYATTYHNSGVYSDVVLKAGKYRGDVKLQGDSADTSAWAYSASYEIGKTIRNDKGWFVEPQAQLVYGHMQGADDITAAGSTVKRDGINSFLGRAGFTAGRQINKTSDYYVKANLWREFAGNGGMELAATNNFGDREFMPVDGHHKDTWFEIGIGGNVQLAENTHLYGDVLKTFGADIQKKWQINAGVRFEF